LLEKEHLRTVKATLKATLLINTQKPSLAMAPKSKIEAAPTSSSPSKPAIKPPLRPPMSPTNTVDTAASSTYADSASKTTYVRSSDGFAHTNIEDEDNERGAAIRVIVRCRPFLGFEKGNTTVVNILPNDQIKITPKDASSLDDDRYTFTFDATYPLESTQPQVFKRSIRPLVSACLQGYNATVLAYGQTGSGKTHTILGQTNESNANVAPEDDMSEAGVIPRALRAIFYALDQAKHASNDTMKFDYTVKVEFLELYGEDVRDLLNPDPDGTKLSIRDGRAGVEPEVLGIKKIEVENADDALLCLTRGSLRRVTRATSMNAESSRSHAIMTVVIEQRVTHYVDDPSGKSGRIEEKSTRNSKFHFVDLAGSERIKRTNASGQGIKEGININKGLLVLGNVISALAAQSTNPNKKEAFVPYRDSKLTRLLKGSLGGNHKTLMVACCSPSGSNTDETINTLRYANRAKNIQNKAVINMDAGSKMISELRDQLKIMAKEFLFVRSMVDDTVVLDNEKTIFTQDVLTALAGGGEVKLNLDNPTSKPKLKRAASTTTDASSTSSPTSPSTIDETVETKPSTNTASSSSPTKGTSPTKSGKSSKLFGSKKDTSATTSSNSGGGGGASGRAVSPEPDVSKAKEEIKKLRRALEKSDDRVLESERQLAWIKEELRISREEVNAMTAVDKSTDGDSASNVSALTEDFGELPRLSQDTYETVKSIYEEKLHQMTLELKEREDERDNIAMTLYRHESDSQRLFYVKNTLTDDLTRKEQQIQALKQELRDMGNLTVVANASPQAERTFRRLRGRASKRLAKNASASANMGGYYTEKLSKIDRHIKLRQEECENLGKELEKLEADSQIFTDLAKDLSDRLNAKDKQMSDMKGKTKAQLKKLGVVIEKDEEERDQLVAELKRLKDDSETFSALVKALTEERKTKLEHVEKYKKRHREMAVSIGMTSPYTESSGTSSGEDVDDDASVSSTWSLMSIDTVATSTSTAAHSTGTISKIDYDQKISQLEANITKYEEDRIFILNDLEKLENDTHAFTELSNSLKLKLQQKEDQIQRVKKELDEFAERLKNQEKELANLTKDEVAKGDLKNGKSGDPVYMNGRGENIVIR